MKPSNRQLPILPYVIMVLVVIAVFIYGLSVTGVETRYSYEAMRHSVAAPLYIKPNHCWIPKKDTRWISPACADSKYYYGKRPIEIPARSKYYRVRNDLYDLSCHPEWIENCAIEKIIPDVFYVPSSDGETR